jgi:hypothetical protein
VLVAALGPRARSIVNFFGVGEPVGAAMQGFLDCVLALAYATLGLGSLSAQVCSSSSRLLRQLVGLFATDHG